MGWNQSVFTLLFVTSSSGTPTGLFIYNGAPATGNLVAQIVAPGVTADPFGNAVAAVANFGHWSGAGTLLRHFGIDANGNTYLANASGLTVVFENSSDGSIQFYNSAGQGAGNLIASIAPASGTDPAGNNYDGPGFASYSGLLTAILNAASLKMFNILNNTISLTPSGLTVFNASGATIFSLDETRDAFFLYAETGSASQGTLIASVASGSGTDSFGNSFNDRLTSYIAGTAFRAGHAVTPITSPVNLVSASFTNLFGGLAVSASNYMLQAHLLILLGPNATALNFQLTGPSTGANTSIKWWLTIKAGAGQSMFVDVTSATGVSVTLPSGTNIGANAGVHVWVSAYLQFTAAGTVNMQAQTSVGGATATVGVGSTFELYPT